MKNCKVMTPMDCKIKHNKDDGGKVANSAVYKCLVWSLQYFIVSKPDIIYGLHCWVSICKNQQSYIG